MTKSQRNLILLFLSLGQGSVYFLPYIRNVYYTPLLNALSVTNLEFGSLVSYFAIGCMFLYIPGGIMSDRWDYKKNIVYSLYATGILVASFAFYLNYLYAQIVFFLLALSTTFVFWASVLKAVRILGKDEQEKSYGLFYALQGAASILTQSGFLIVYNLFPDQVMGLKAVLLLNAAITLFAGVACHYYLPSSSEIANESTDVVDNGFKFNMIGTIIKNPIIWIISIFIFCAYGLYSNSYYFTTYLTSVKGLDFNVGASLSLIRVTYMMCIASFIGGFIASKLKSTTVWYIICAIGAATSCALFIMLSKTDINVMLLGVLSVFPSAFMLLVYGLTSSLYSEYKIPLEYTGTAIGIVSIIGYTPDLIFGPLLGSFLDAQGDAGYITIFTFFSGLAVLGAICGFIALNIKRKQNSEVTA